MASPDDTAFYDDTLKSAGDHAQPNLIHHLVDNVRAVIMVSTACHHRFSYHLFVGTIGH